MITVTFLNGCILATAEQSLWQYSYNQQLQINGLELPGVFTVDFCNEGDTTTVAMIGSSGVVDIPNELLTSGRDIVAYVFQKSALTGGVTRCEIRIDVLTRPERDDETPTPEQEAVIDQYIAELNEGVEKANESAEDAEAWAVGERGGEPVSESDPTYENNAKYWAENISGQLEDYRTAADQDAIDSAQDGKINALTNLLNKKQSKITANGILKGDGNGGISAAVPGMDYLPTSALYAYRSAIKQDEIDNAQNANIAKNADDIADVKTTADTALQPAALAPYRTAADQDTIDNAQTADIAAINDKIPSTASKNNKLVAWSTFNGQLGTKQAKITANGILKGDGAGGVSAAVAGTDYLAPSALAAYRTAAAQDEIDAAQDADIDDLKSAIDEVEQGFPYYPAFVRGFGNNNTGTFTPSDSVLNRLIEMDFIPTSSFNEIHVKFGIDFIVCYYDNNKEFAGNSGSWKRFGQFALDTTKTYARILLKNTDGSNFANVPTDACYLVNNNKDLLQKNVYDTVNDAIFGTVYSESGITTNAANTVRWFIAKELSSGWLKQIRVKQAIYAGVVTVELWKRNADTFTRYSTADFAVEVGDNVLNIDAEIQDSTYITLSSSITGNVRCGAAGDNRAYLLRDKTSTTFSYNDLEKLPYALTIDVLWYGLPENTTHVYHIGENDNAAEIITNAMRYQGSIVYIEPYEHDCIAEWEAFFGTTYFSAMSTGRGLELKNDVHIIGRSGHKLKCYYTGDNDYVMENFSLFNNLQGGSGYTLENVCIDTKKIRYCIHDERASDTTPYKVRYSRCIMSQDMTGSTWDHSRACIGGGLGSYGDVIVEDCIFSTVTSEQNMDSLAYHNGSGDKCDSSIVIKNCYCTGDSTLQLASDGTSTKKTKVIVANCSFGSPIEILDWTSGTPNLEIYQINNEVRT